MAINTMKKFLLAGTALVAVSAFSVQAFAVAGTAGTVGASVAGNATTSTGATTGGAGSGGGADAAAGAGGIGIQLITGGGGTATLTGAVAGGAAEAAFAAGAANTTDVGGAGGLGFDFSGMNGTAPAYTTVINQVSITGSNGTVGATGNGGNGSVGGAGGIGVTASGNYNAIQGAGTITGGNGAAGGAGNGANATGAVGGNGGIAVNSTGTYFSLTSSGLITGGNAGGVGANISAAAGVINTATAGDAVKVAGTNATIAATGAVVGGIGGTGGSGVGANSAGAAGTAGGIGYNLIGGSNTDLLTITANATGGLGGAGGNGAGSANNVNGAAGGVGVALVGTTETVNITGATTVVAGGVGGAAGTGGGGTVAIQGVGGAGLTVNTGIGDIITNAGIIKGGVGSTSGIGVDIEAVATLTNTGTIGSATTETGNALKLGAALTAFSNTGTITNTSTSAGNATVLVSADQLVNFTNAGTITQANAGNGVAVNLTSVQTGTFINSGTINSLGAGVTTALASGTAVDLNAAAVQAFSNTGFVYGNVIDGTTSTATVSNSGTMVGSILLTQAGASHTINLTGGSLSAATATPTLSPVITNGGVLATLNITGTPTLTGVTQLGAFANVLNIGDGTIATTFGTNGAILATGGTIATTVKSGATFNVNNTFTPLAGALGINAGGTMHVIGANVVATGATLTNAGTLTVDAGRTVSVAALAGTGTYNIGVTSTPAGVETTGIVAQSGAGGTSLAGNTIHFVVAPTSSPLTVGVHSMPGVFTAASGNYTTAGATVTGNSALYNFALLGTGFNTDVSVTSNLATVGTTAGNQSAGNTLLGTTTNYTNGINTGSAANLALNAALPVAQQGVLAGGQLADAQGRAAAAPTAAAANTVFESLQPDVNGSSTAAAFSIGDMVHGVSDTRMASLRSGDGLTGMAAGASANGVSMWLQGYGQSAMQGTRSGIAGYDSDTLGAAIGVDTTAMGNGVLGFAINYGRTNADSKNANTTSTNIDNYGFGLYGSADLGDKMFLNGQAGYAYNSITSDRHAVGGGLLTAHGDYHSDQYSAKLALGRDYGMDHGLIVTPTVSASYAYLSNSSYSETGAGGADLNVNSNNVDAVNLGVGLNAAWKLKNTDGTTMTPSLHGNYAYDVTDSKIQTTASFAGDSLHTAFTSTGATPSRNKFDLGAGIVYATAANWDLSASYDYSFQESYHAHNGMLRATSHF